MQIRDNCLVPRFAGGLNAPRRLWRHAGWNDSSGKMSLSMPSTAKASRHKPKARLIVGGRGLPTTAETAQQPIDEVRLAVTYRLYECQTWPWVPNARPA